MALSVENLKQHLNWTSDMGSADDALLTRLLASAKNHVERLLGYKLEDATERPGFEDGTPPALEEAIYQLAAWWFGQREAALVGVSVARVPYDVDAIVQEYRDWTF
ncbi:head-tail connector protein [Devosia sp.]|uniref:head-tail connector protein n=1 Tax=Devosia sp. TaxID=1871048 RepID=UPI001AD20DFD|nr:head-tail connector protein [Devosia sp.]MBN9335377.1 phage gp6-like head-tail connector protein [Devosia sp.]